MLGEEADYRKESEGADVATLHPSLPQLLLSPGKFQTEKKHSFLDTKQSPSSCYPVTQVSHPPMQAGYNDLILQKNTP